MVLFFFADFAAFLMFFRAAAFCFAVAIDPPWIMVRWRPPNGKHQLQALFNTDSTS
jgi:hypothetical protein